MAPTTIDQSTLQRLQSRSLQRMPGLDGVRAIAVLAVLAFHANESWLPGGFLGVDVFFTLSGFLITSLLLTEVEAAGGIHLGRFYQRRAKRLVPALALVLVATSLLAMTVAQDAAARVREDILASAFYVTNWWYVLHGTSYFEATGRPPLLQHLWSLAVEEQFYLAWPLIVYGLWRLGRVRAVRIGAVVGALGSTVLMGWIAVRHGIPGATDSGRVYFGTDTHAMTLLVGAALATFWKQGGVISALTPKGLQVISRAGMAALATLVALFWFIDPLSPGLYRGGFLVVAVVTAVVVASAAVTGTAFARGLARQPLRWIGDRSYGIYLWHWPIFMVLRPGVDLEAQGWPVQVARFGLTFLVAELSYRFVEMPVRRGAVGRIWAGWKESGRLRLASRVRLAVATTGGLVLALGVGLSAAQEPTLQDALAGVTSVGADSLTAAPDPAERHEAPAPTTAPPSTAGSSPGWTARSAYTGPSAPPADPDPPAAVPERAGLDPAKLSTTAVGDSVMVATSKALNAQIPRMTVDADISRQPRKIFDRIRERHKLGRLGDVVVIGAGTNGRIRAEDLISLLDLLKDRKRVILVTCHADKSWIAKSNASIEKAAGLFAKGNVRVADWDDYAVRHRAMLWGDGIHPKGPGTTAYVRLIREAIRS
jgi:peptidoglycan/LPS O-acetylase OafA/YrhL